MTIHLLLAASALLLVVASGDPAAALRQKLLQIAASDAFLFGHHGDNVQGQEWIECSGSDAPDCETFGGNHSDTKLATGQMAGVVELDMSWMILDPDVDFAPAVQAALDAGAVVSFDFHANNPVTAPGCKPVTNECGSFNDHRGNPIVELLPGGTANDVWRSWLDVLADLVLSFPDAAFIFRPMHEMTLTMPSLWWWSNGTGVSPAQYRAAVNYTRHYLVEGRGVRNLLFAYAPAKPGVGIATWPVAFPTTTDPEAYYPGDDVVDIVCFDSYDKDPIFSEHFLASCSRVVEFAKAHGKIPAACEFGIRGGLQNSAQTSFFTAGFLSPLAERCPGLAYALTWQNGKYWLPGRQLHGDELSIHNATAADTSHHTSADTVAIVGGDDGNTANSSTTIAGKWSPNSEQRSEQRD